jgi:hypothetical protein
MISAFIYGIIICINSFLSMILLLFKSVFLRIACNSLALMLGFWLRRACSSSYYEIVSSLLESKKLNRASISVRKAFSSSESKVRSFCSKSFYMPSRQMQNSFIDSMPSLLVSNASNIISTSSSEMPFT